MVTSDVLADALVEKLMQSGFPIDPETVTCAELLEIIKTAQIQPPPSTTT